MPVHYPNRVPILELFWQNQLIGFVPSIFCNNVSHNKTLSHLGFRGKLMNGIAMSDLE